MKKKAKRRVAAAAAASVIAVSAVVNVSFDAEELIHSADYLSSHTQYVQTAQERDYDITYTEMGELSKADSIRAWFIRLPVVAKSAILLPLWAIGSIPVAVGTAVGAALAPFWSQILGFILQAAILVGVFCGVYKLLFPEKKIRDLFKKKNFKWLVIGAVALTTTNAILSYAWAGWSILRVVLMIAAGGGVLGLLWKRICGKEKAPEPEPVQTRLVLEY
ncbi:MAG: hypothetical protein LUH42_05745 [Oscillospiraceae bacterium]|nr:hypothetical protein [Oscillospiraceae bacterium]